jgi:hypothetical protein
MQNIKQGSKHLRLSEILFDLIIYYKKDVDLNLFFGEICQKKVLTNDWENPQNRQSKNSIGRSIQAQEIHPTNHFDNENIEDKEYRNCKKSKIFWSVLEKESDW